MVAELRINNWATTSGISADIRTTISVSANQSGQHNWATTSAHNAPVVPRETTEGAQWATTSDSGMFWLNVCHLITSAHHLSTACSTALQQRQKAASVVTVVVAAAVAAAAAPTATTEPFPQNYPGEVDGRRPTGQSPTSTSTQPTPQPQPPSHNAPVDPRESTEGAPAAAAAQLGNDIRFRIRLSWLNTGSAGQ